MLDVIRRGQRWLTAIFVVGIGGVFAVFIGLGGPITTTAGDAAIVVGPHRIGLGEFDRARRQSEENFERMMGDAFDARRFAEAIESNTTNLLVERAILALEAEEMGLTVSKQEVEREVLSAIPELVGPDGRVDRQGFDNWVYRQFGSERAFREEHRRTTLAGKMIRMLYGQAAVSEAEARASLEARLEKVKLAFPVLRADEVPADFARDEPAIAAYLAENEAAVKAVYDERSEVFDVPERARARHVLVRVEPGADEAEKAEARIEIEAARARIDGGEDFAAVAADVSDDPGSASSGGELGWFRRGQMVSAFDEAAFTLEPGVVSEPIETEYGFHVIEVHERRDAQHQSFDEVKADLAFERMGQEAASERARALAEQVATAVKAGQSVEAAAREAGLTLERSDWITRRADGYVPGFAASPELLATAFSLEPGESSPRIFEAEGKLALIQVLDHEPAAPEVVEAQLEDEQKRLRQERFEQYVSTWIRERREELAADGELIIDVEAIRG